MATGASTDCWHSQAQVQVLAAKVSMTQSGAECGKCSLATKPREEQAGLGLPAAGRQRRVRRAGRWLRSRGSQGAADEARPGPH